MVTWEVAIDWYQLKVCYKKNESCVTLEERISDWWSYMIQLWYHQCLCQLLCLVFLHLLPLLFQIYFDFGDAQFVKAVFIIWEFGRNFCDLEWQGLDLCFFYSKFIKAVLIAWEFVWNICEFFFLIVHIGTYIGKCCKHIRDVVIQGFCIRVMFVSHVFDVIVNVVGVKFW